MTAPMTWSTNGSEVSAARALTQSPGRLRVEIDFEFDYCVLVRGPAGDWGATHGDPGAGGLGPVDVDAGAAGQRDAQHHRFERRPATPITGGKGVEVRRERHLRLRADLQRGAGRRVRTPGVGFRFLDIELADVERLTRPRQDDSGEKTDRLGFPGVECAGRNIAHSLLLSVNGTPSRRCGASVLSYMFSALAMAMCMSRY